MLMTVRGASFRYKGGRKIFEDVSFSLEEGQTLSILGPNGCGKSTLLGCLTNMLKLSSGEILIFDKPQSVYSAKEIARIVGYVPQFHNLPYGYSVRDFVVMGRAPYMSVLAAPGEKEFKMADDAIERMSIAHLASRPYTEISGGERQQAMLAKVIVQQPKIIMMDEPTSALDFGNQLRTLELIEQLASEGYAVIMTTHTPDHAIMLDGTVGLMDSDGHLRTGGVEEIMTEDVLCGVYKTNLKMVYVPQVNRTACLAKSNKK